MLHTSILSGSHYWHAYIVLHRYILLDLHAYTSTYAFRYVGTYDVTYAYTCICSDVDTYSVHAALTLMLILRPRSLDLALGRGGVGMFTFLRPRSFDLAQLRCSCYAHMKWGVGWADVRPSLRKTLMPAPVGCGGAMLLLIGPCTRLWCCAQDNLIIPNYHGSGWGGAGSGGMGRW